MWRGDPGAVNPSLCCAWAALNHRLSLGILISSKSAERSIFPRQISGEEADARPGAGAGTGAEIIIQQE